jgi:hypothetical protein
LTPFFKIFSIPNRSLVIRSEVGRTIRRLVCSKSKQKNVDGRSREDAQSSNKSRFHSKFGKVKFNPNTEKSLAVA